MNAWRELFREWEPLPTEVKRNPFYILRFQDDGIEIKVPGRADTRKIVLHCENLDLLWRDRKEVRTEIRSKD